MPNTLARKKSQFNSSSGTHDISNSLSSLSLELRIEFQNICMKKIKHDFNVLLVLVSFSCSSAKNFFHTCILVINS